MKTKYLMVLFLLAACGKDIKLPEVPVDPGAPLARTEAPEATPTPTPTSAPGDPVVTLSVRSLTKVVASMTTAGVTTSISGTGSCAVYLAKTYCWDDGEKVFSGDTNGISYFAIGDGPVSCSFYGACSSDPLSTPAEMTVGLAGLAPLTRKPAEVLSSGSAVVTSVDCNEHGGVLTCPAFTLDTTRGSL